MATIPAPGMEWDPPGSPLAWRSSRALLSAAAYRGPARDGALLHLTQLDLGSVGSEGSPPSAHAYLEAISLENNRSRAPEVRQNISTFSDVPMLEANLVVSSSRSSVDIFRPLPSGRLCAHSDALKRSIKSASKELARSSRRMLSARKVAKTKDPPGRKLSELPVAATDRTSSKVREMQRPNMTARCIPSSRKYPLYPLARHDGLKAAMPHHISSQHLNYTRKSC
jgi:hypothetical protein